MPGSYSVGTKSVKEHNAERQKAAEERRKQIDAEVKARQSVPRPTSISATNLPNQTIERAPGIVTYNPIYTSMLDAYAEARGIKEKPNENDNPFITSSYFYDNLPSRKQLVDYYKTLIENTASEELNTLDSLYKEEVNNQKEISEIRNFNQKLQKQYTELATEIFNPSDKFLEEQNQRAKEKLATLGYSKENLGEENYNTLVSNVVNKYLLSDIIDLEQVDPKTENDYAGFHTKLTKEDLNNLSWDDINEQVNEWSINRLLLNKHADNPDLFRMLTLKYEDKVKAYKNLPTKRDIKIAEDIKESVGFGFFLGPESGATNVVVEEILGEDDLEDYVELLDTYINDSSKNYSKDLEEPINNTVIAIQNQYNSGEISEKEIDDCFEKLAINYMPEYMAFKGDVELEDFSIYDKIKYIATFQEMSKVNPYMAVETLRRDMQRYISDHQGFVRTTGYALQNIITGTVSQIVQTGLGLYGLGVRSIGGEKEYVDFMNGETVNYWNDVDKYNTFNEDELNKARKWGVSAQTAVVAPEDQFDIFTKHTLGEVLKQGKYVMSMGLTAGGASLGFKLLGKAGKAMKIGANMSAKTAKAFNTGVNLASQGFAVMGMAHTMAKNTFDETLTAVNALIDQKIENKIKTLSRNSEVRQEVLTEYFNSPELLLEQETVLKDAEKQFNEYLKSQKINPDSKSPKIQRAKEDYLKNVKDEFLLNKTKYAEENIESLIRNKYKEQLDEEVAEDRKKAQLAAGRAAATQATISGLKEFSFNLIFGQWKFASKNRVKLGDRTTNIKFDGTKAIPGKSAITKWDVAKTWLKRSAAEFGDEWFDAHSEHFSQGLGLSYFNDITNDYYNPEAYLKSNNTTYNFLTHINAGIKSVADGFFDESGLYEAMIGAISGGLGVNPNVAAMVFQGKTKYAEGFGFKEDNKTPKTWNDLTGLQKFNFYVSNGVISDIIEEKENIKQDEILAEAINNVVAKNGVNFQDIHKIISNHEKELQAAHEGKVTASKDFHTRQGFELATMVMDDVMSQHPYIQQHLKDLERLAKGKITEEDVKEYVNQPHNKKLRDDPNATQIAKEALQENATQLIRILAETKKAYKELNESKYGKLLTEDTKKQLVLNRVYDFEAHERLNNSEEQIQGAKKEYTTTHNKSADFNSEAGYKAMIESIEDNVAELESLIKTKTEELQKLSPEDEKGKTALEYYISSLEISLQMEKEALQELKDEGYKSNSRPILSKNEIMQLNPAQRAQMLDPNNKFRYKKEQQKIIEELYNELLLSNPKALQLINEAGEVYQNKQLNLEAYNKIINNHEVFESYVEYMKESFAQRAHNAAIKIVATELHTKLSKVKNKDLKDFLINEKYSHSVLEEYIKKYVKKGSKREKALQKVVPLLKVYKDARVSATNKLAEYYKERFENILYNVMQSSNTVEEVMTSLEKFLDTIEDEKEKEAFEIVLQDLALNNYQRDTKIIEDRKKRQEELKKQREEEEIKKRKALQEDEEEIKETEKDLGEEETTTEETKDTEEKEEPSPKPDSTSEVDEKALQSPSLAEQSKQEGVSEVKTVNINAVDDNTFDETSSTEYTGTPWSEFDNIASSKYHFLEDERESLDKESNEDLDYKKQYFKFIDDNKIKIQEIVDYELAKIFENNPDVKVHFMMTPVNTNAQGIPFLVVEYTSEVEKIHKKERGGVITAKGKRWLIIGNAYSKTDEYAKELIPFLKDDRPNKMKPEDKFYVSDIYTKIKEIKSGRLVKRQLGENRTVNRNVSELLYDTDENGNTINNATRNPEGLGYAKNTTEGYSNVKWGIQKAYEFITVNTSGDVVVEPASRKDNQGAAFILVPTTNGKFIPAYINPTFYNPIEGKNGIKENSDLKNKINKLAIKLTSSSLEKRKQAKDELRQFLVFDDNTNIEIGSENMATLTVVKNGRRVGKPHSIKDGVNIIEILNTLNPRINITVSTLTDNSLMKMYEEAGALTTDISLLHTRNGSFTVFPVNTNGEIQMSEVNTHNLNQPSNKKKDKRVPLNGVQYSFYDNTWHDENDNVVTDAELIQTIEYKKAINGRTAEFVGKAGDNYHILSDDTSNPIVLRVDNKGQINKQSKEEANNTITRYKTYLESKKTAQNSIEEIKLEESKEESKADTLPEVNPTEQLFGNFDSETKSVTGETVTQTTESKEVSEKDDKKPTNNLDSTKDLTTFDTLFKKTSFKGPLKAIFKEKAKTDPSWKWGRNSSDVAKVLESKGVSLLNITNIEDWLNMIKNCK